MTDLMLTRLALPSSLLGSSISNVLNFGSVPSNLDSALKIELKLSLAFLITIFDMVLFYFIRLVLFC